MIQMMFSLNFWTNYTFYSILRSESEALNDKQYYVRNLIICVIKKIRVGESNY